MINHDVLKSFAHLAIAFAFMHVRIVAGDACTDGNRHSRTEATILHMYRNQHGAHTAYILLCSFVLLFHTCVNNVKDRSCRLPSCWVQLYPRQLAHKPNHTSLMPHVECAQLTMFPKQFRGFQCENSHMPCSALVTKQNVKEAGNTLTLGGSRSLEVMSA